MLQRRGLITGLAGLLVTPAIVRATSLMPVKAPRRFLTDKEYFDRVLDRMLREINPPLFYGHSDSPSAFSGFRLFMSPTGLQSEPIRASEMYIHPGYP